MMTNSKEASSRNNQMESICMADRLGAADSRRTWRRTRCTGPTRSGAASRGETIEWRILIYFPSRRRRPALATLARRRWCRNASKLIKIGLEIGRQAYIELDRSCTWARRPQFRGPPAALDLAPRLSRPLLSHEAPPPMGPFIARVKVKVRPDRAQLGAHPESKFNITKYLAWRRGAVLNAVALIPTELPYCATPVMAQISSSANYLVCLITRPLAQNVATLARLDTRAARQPLIDFAYRMAVEVRAKTLSLSLSLAATSRCSVDPPLLVWSSVLSSNSSTARPPVCQAHTNTYFLSLASSFASAWTRTGPPIATGAWLGSPICCFHPLRRPIKHNRNMSGPPSAAWSPSSPGRLSTGSLRNEPARDGSGESGKGQQICWGHSKFGRHES